ncbi:MAG TPA: hypothetical protein DHV48_10335 [Prolixibacteraceae bacterium]|nr:hypothetical protein [Prolixibacteraceae bacterium]
MNQEERKDAVLAWIQSGCNYDEGVKLYSQFGKNNFLRKDFPRKEKKYTTKIIYELCKSAGLNYHQLKAEDKIPVFQEKLPEQKTIQKPELFVVPSGETLPVKELPEIMEAKDLVEYPAAMRRIIAEYAELFQERSKMHRILTEMPEGNSQALKTKRAEIFDVVKSLSVRLEFLYAIRQQFDLNGEIPLDDEIWPAPKEELETELPDDPDQLRKMKKNQQSANTKDQNMLDYQSEKKAGELCPMPAGPKRMKLENRIKARVKFIQEIDLKLVKTDAV